jgi:hypothetical protein
MHPQTQLLCTFTSHDTLAETLATIQDTYTLQFDRVYVLQNVDDAAQLVITYNVTGYLPGNHTPPASTISVHRKKFTNTIYTINAINKLIEEKNGGILDTKYQIDWDSLKNTILVTAYGQLKCIHTKLLRIVELTP